MRIGIAHRNVVSYDAVGNDILGMYDTLVECGLSVRLIGEYFDTATTRRAKTVLLQDVAFQADFDALIYHHSIIWDSGEAFLRAVKGPKLLKYHNVTPPEFFVPYSERYVAMCATGRAQTARLVALCDGGCTADSAYNAAELTAAGAASVSVVPPFTQASSLVRMARPQPKPPFRILFVGRVAPNKGHFDLVTVIAAYVAAIGPDIRLTIVGGFDDNLMEYKAGIDQQIEALGLAAQVEWRNQVDDRMLHKLFMEASVFLCMSEHEGFCVPIIEAQAAGLPVIAVGATAIAETMGAGQIIVERPETRHDFLYIARLIHAVCTDDRLRRQVIAAGHRNVLSRFTPQAVAGQFMTAMAPILALAS